MDHILCLHLPVDGLFPLLATVNNTPLSICVQVFAWTCIFVSLGWMPRGGIAGSYGNSTVYHFEELLDHLPK